MTDTDDDQPPNTYISTLREERDEAIRLLREYHLGRVGSYRETCAFLAKHPEEP